MTPELLLLLAVTLVALQVVSLVVHRDHVSDAPYLGLLSATLGVLVWAHLTHRSESLPAFVGESVAAVLVFGPRLLESLERAAIGQDALLRAVALSQVRELIQPGKSAARRRRQLTNLAEARSGGTLAVARRLRGEIAGEREGTRALQLREELATLLFFDRRFAEGIAEVEGHLGIRYVAERPVFAAYLVRAYGETGELSRAAEVMTLLEDVGSADPLLSGLLAQARLTFLAFSGCLQHVEAVLAGAFGRAVPPEAHAFLLDVARTRSRGTLQRPPIEVPPGVRALTEEVFRRAQLPPRPLGRPLQRTAATLALVGVNLAVYLGLEVLDRLGHGDAEGLLVRAGSLFRPAVLNGEWWRLFTTLFLHAGLPHVGFNVLCLFFLGRFVERELGAARLLSVYLLAGLSGALATTLLGAAVLSLGASGAVMGLLGALLVMLVLRRGSWPETWRRMLLVNMTFLGALVLYLGFQVPLVDNAAHVGGLLGGAAAALLLAPGGLVGTGERGKRVARVLAAVLCATVLLAFGLQAATPLGDTLSRVPAAADNMKR